MDIQEFRKKVENNPNFLLEVILTSNPIEHRELMQGFGENVGLDIDDMMLSFKRLKGNKDYIELFREVPIIWSELPKGYKEELAETYIVKRSSEDFPIREIPGIPPPEPQGGTETDVKKDKKGNGDFWNFAGVFVGGIFNSLLNGQKKEQRQPEPSNKKDYTLWYVLGGGLLLLIVFLLLFKK